jgi:hypothetical protein
MQIQTAADSKTTHYGYYSNAYTYCRKKSYNSFKCRNCGLIEDLTRGYCSKLRCQIAYKLKKYNKLKNEIDKLVKKLDEQNATNAQSAGKETPNVVEPQRNTA